MSRKSVQPSVNEVAFDCPHCGAYTSHTWYDLHAAARDRDSRTPGTIDADIVSKLADLNLGDDDHKKELIETATKVVRGLVVVEQRSATAYNCHSTNNLHLSRCFTCDEISVWVSDRVLFPTPSQGPPPNPDLPGDVALDYNEAGRILALSPRGAAALLRLAIQKLCVVLEEKGKNIDDDIASLVKKGLSPVIQQALDAVRVIGNEAVHPGTIDLRDDVDTATKLFGVVNIITEQMISNPKHVKELYDKLPEAKRKAIEKRDATPPE